MISSVFRRIAKNRNGYFIFDHSRHDSIVRWAISNSEQRHSGGASSIGRFFGLYHAAAVLSKGSAHPHPGRHCQNQGFISLPELRADSTSIGSPSFKKKVAN